MGIENPREFGLSDQWKLSGVRPKANFAAESQSVIEIFQLIQESSCNVNEACLDLKIQRTDLLSVEVPARGFLNLYKISI